MSNDNISAQLSDKTLELKPNSLSEVCSNWQAKVFKIDIASIDVVSVFSPLTNVGIGTSYIPSLKKALDNADNLVLSANSTIKETIEEQTAVDDKYYRKERSTRHGNRSNSNSSGGVNGTSSNQGTSVDNKNKKVEINRDFIDVIKSLDEEKYIKFMTVLGAASNGNLLQYLVEEQSASELKALLLSSPNIDKDLKKIILEMDENELQVTLQTMFTEKTAITDLSRTIIYKYTENLANDSNVDMIKATTTNQFYDNVDELYDDVNSLKEKTDLQENASAIYNGDANDGVSENSAKFLKTAIDEIAASNKMTADELLNNSSNSDKLKNGLASLSKDLSFFRTINTMGEEASEVIYNNLVKGEK